MSIKSPNHPWLLLDDKNFLIKLNGYRIDRRENVEGVTLAGLLMFGKFGSIIDNYACPQYFPDYREYFSGNEEDRWTNRVCPDGTWEANLFQFYYRVYPKLANALPTPFSLNNGLREDETPMHEALREAFVNSLVHCDYSVDSNITIELHKDSYIFSNPGTLLLPITKYYQGGNSVCRNKALQNMFMMIGSAEKAGSGADKIMRGWEKANYRNPNIEEISRPNKVVLTLPLVSVLSNEIILCLKSLYGENVMSIDNDKMIVLATCCSEGEISNYRLQFLLSKHRVDITKLLKELCEENMLVSSGVGRGTRYKINKDYSKGASKGAEKSDPKVLDKRVRQSKEELFAMILDVCTEYTSLEDIANSIGKTVSYLKNKVIPRMVEQDLLERKYPNFPTHPMQQYKVK